MRSRRRNCKPDVPSARKPAKRAIFRTAQMNLRKITHKQHLTNSISPAAQGGKKRRRSPMSREEKEHLLKRIAEMDDPDFRFVEGAAAAILALKSAPQQAEEQTK